MRRLLLALALAGGLLVLVPSPSWACSCAIATLAQQVERADTVATGTVDWTATDGQTLTYRVAFDAVYKGEAARGEKVTTAAQESACGLTTLQPEERYLFFINGRHRGEMSVNLCGGTVASDDAILAEVESILGPPGEPLAEPGAPSGEAEDGGVPWLGVGAAVVVAAGLVAVVVRRRRTG